MDTACSLYKSPWFERLFKRIGILSARDAASVRCDCGRSDCSGWHVNLNF